MEVGNISKCLPSGPLLPSLFLQISRAQKFISEGWTLQSQNERRAQGWNSLVLLRRFITEFTMFDCTFCQGCWFLSLWWAEGSCRQDERLLGHHLSANPAVEKMLSLEKKILCYVHGCEKILRHCETYSCLGYWPLFHLIFLCRGTCASSQLAPRGDPSTFSLDDSSGDSRKSCSFVSHHNPC